MSRFRYEHLPLSGDGVLAHGDVQPRLPCQDLERARRFYADKLGLEPVEEREGGLRYRCGSTVFSLFASTGTSSGTHTRARRHASSTSCPRSSSQAMMPTGLGKERIQLDKRSCC